MTDHYATLGVAPDADQDALKAAYRRAAAEAHPDKAGGDTARMQAVNAAWEVLSDPAQRELYDARARPELRLLEELFGQALEAASPHDYVIRELERGLSTMHNKLAWVIRDAHRVRSLANTIRGKLWETTVAARLAEREEQKIGMTEHIGVLQRALDEARLLKGEDG